MMSECRSYVGLTANSNTFPNILIAWLDRSYGVPRVLDEDGKSPFQIRSRYRSVTVRQVQT